MAGPPEKQDLGISQLMVWRGTQGPQTIRDARGDWRTCVELTIYLSQGNIQKVMALIDTGFGCLPPQEDKMSIAPIQEYILGMDIRGDRLSKPILESSGYELGVQVFRRCNWFCRAIQSMSPSERPSCARFTNMKQYRLLGGQEENTTIQEWEKVGIIRPTHSPTTPLCGQLNRKLEAYHCVPDLPIHSLEFPLLMNHKTNFHSHWSVGSGPSRFNPKGPYIHQPFVIICGL